MVEILHSSVISNMLTKNLVYMGRFEDYGKNIFLSSQCYRVKGLKEIPYIDYYYTKLNKRLK